MAPAHEEDVASGGRRRNHLSWVTLFCFGGHGQEASSAAEGTTTTWERSEIAAEQADQRTVPVDGDLVRAAAADSEVTMRRGTSTSTDEESRKRKGLCLPGCCCFLAPAREHSAMDSSSGRNKQRHPERTAEQPPPRRRSQSDKNSPSTAAAEQSAGGSSSTSNGNGSRSRGAEQSRSETTTRTPTTTSKPSKTTGAGVGAFGPVVGLSVVVTVSMAGLLGGRLWAVACVCAWLAALSRLRRREATAAAC